MTTREQIRELQKSIHESEEEQGIIIEFVKMAMVEDETWGACLSKEESIIEQGHSVLCRLMKEENNRQFLENQRMKDEMIYRLNTSVCSYIKLPMDFNGA